MRKIAFLLLALALPALSGALEKQPPAVYRARRQALAEKAGAAVLMFAAVEQGESLYGFRQDNNFYYLTGWTEPGAALLILPAQKSSAANETARAYTEILFLPAHNLIREKFTGPKLTADNPQAARLAGVDRVEALDKLRDLLAELLPRGELPAPAPKLYTDLAGDDAESPATLPLAWLRRANAFGRVSMLDAKPLLKAMRMVKDAGEMEFIRKAVAASDEAHKAALKAMKPGINEREISALMQFEFEKRGCERPAYAPIVGSGPFSTVLHYDADDRQMQPGEVVVMDVGGEYSMYAADITRTLAVSGKFSARQREIYEIVLGAQQAAERVFVAGKSMMTGMADNSLFRAAYDYINTHGKDSHGQPLGKYFVHGLGHHVGLEVHDAGDYTVPLDKGNVFTLEPGIYIPEENLGVRIEDMYWVDAGGKLVKLSADLPSGVDEVQK